MAAKLLHSLTDENPDLQKQIGCMTGIFQLFDRQHIITSGRPSRTVGHTAHPKRLPPPPGNFSYGTAERESNNNAHLRSTSHEKYSQKNMQDKQRVSTESSRASFSSSSRSSSFSSIDCNRATQLEPASFDRIIFPETPSRDSTMSLQNSSPRLSRQSLDLRDLVKDSMYREVPGLSIKPKTIEEPKDSVAKYRDTPKSSNESLRVLEKLQESQWSHNNKPRQLLRSTSYHSKDGSSFSVPKDPPRFSYDGRDMNRTPFDSREPSKSTLKLKDLPRLSLDGREGSMRSLNADSKSNFLKTIHKDNNIEFEGKILSLQQARPPSVVAKLMGLDTLPDSVASSDTNMGSSRSFPDEDFVNISSSVAQTNPSKGIQQSSFSKNLWKDPSSPRWRNPDSSMKPMLKFPIEPAPWKHSEGTRGSQKPVSRTTRVPIKSQDTFSSVYSEIEKRLKDLKFTQSGKDLRALKQILEAMQVKGPLETQEEGHGSNFATDSDHDKRLFSSVNDTRSVNNRKPQNDQVLASAKRRVSSTRNYDSPIVIMKPAKLVEKSGIPAGSIIALVDNRKSLNAEELITSSSQRDNAVNYVHTKNDRTLKAKQSSTRSQHLTKDSNVAVVKSSGSISPRMQQQKLELDKRSRPPTPPDSSKSRRQPNKQQVESNSPGGKRRPKQLNTQQSDNQVSEIGVESRKLSHRENENSFEPKIAERKIGISNIHSSSNASELAEKKSSLTRTEDESAYVPPEFSSPISVLDNVVYKDDSPSPIKYTGKTLKVDASNSVDKIIPNSMDSGSTSEINRKKLQNIENLVQKLRRLNSSHDEAHTDYIASLCENTDPDHRYISEILLASGLLLRDLGANPTNFQFHPSGHPINPELFLVLEQTKASNLLKEGCTTEKTSRIMVNEKSHRKLVFDAVNEILARKLASESPFKLAKKTLNAQKLLRELCSEVDGLKCKNPECSYDEEEERIKSILCNEVMHHQSLSWISFDVEISDAVLDIERLIFKDLVNEIVIGESTHGSIIKPDKRRQLFSK
ncbi:hypothetical protein RD792_014929 [Penstemon davidsonii]|uniref:DUF4378 domain-containing protein n=1 Tax=Penstemon davidsonii TaxID=160366 RepID=A0ABR0CQQ1_9LAMI|nr:hypothetical protein RD792_014929 [Penstemon davidsonii]